MSPVATAERAAEHDQAVGAGLRACDELLAAHLARLVRVFGGDGLGVIDLPPLGSEPLVDAQIRVGAVLYWCRELERAALLPLVEALAEALARGTVVLPLGAASTRLLRVWRDRERRWTAPERVALYHQVLDGEGNGVMQGFDAWFSLLVAALAELGRAATDRGLSDLHARVARLATDVGRTLSDRAVGVAAFAAREIVAQVREALGVLSDPDVVRALGGGRPWTLVLRHAPALLGRKPAPSRDLTRAQAGTAILRWIAEVADDVDAGARSLDRDHPIVHAALAWQAAGSGA